MLIFYMAIFITKLPALLQKLNTIRMQKLQDLPWELHPALIKAQAAIYQKTFLAGLSYDEKINNDLQNTTSIYGAYSQMRNPSFRNYGRTTEPHFGGRTIFQFNKKIKTSVLNISAGAEYQQSFNTQRIYNNKNGEPDSLQTDDEIYNNQGFVFAQAILELQKGWIITAGASINKLGLTFRRLSTVPSTLQKRNFDNEFTPRLSILKKVTQSISVYANVARGFSAPTTAEILPSTNNFNTQLQAETGTDFEVGTRGTLLHTKFYFDINAFFYRLKNAIVQRRDVAGADYFDNAGSAKENGVETYLSYQLADNKNHFISDAKIWVSDTWNNFYYINFKQVTTDYSGNKIPGVAPRTMAAGLDARTKFGLYTNLNYFYSDIIQLNDANTDHAWLYYLVDARVGYRQAFKKIQLDVFGGCNNIFDEKYSLGNDINAAGGRYYNVAPGRNYSIGIEFKNIF